MEIRELLTKEYEAAESAPADAVEPSPAAVETAPAAPESGRARDEAGRFTKKENSDQSPSTDVVETPAASEPAPASIEAPRSWSAEKKALFAQLPPDAQAYIAQRETELHNKLTAEGAERGRIAKEYGEIGQLIERERDSWANLGFTPSAAIGQMIATQRGLDANPVEGILRLCQSYGIHPAQLAQATPQIDPQIAPLYRQVNSLQEQLQARDAAFEQAQLAQANKVVEDVRNETDASGNRLRPHFETVEPELDAFLALVMQQRPGASQRDVLAEAYDRAVYANPQTRALVLKEQQAQSEAQRAQAVRQKAAAGSSLTGAPGAALVSNAPKSIRGLLEAGLNGQL
jgi:hypothetical protein